MLKFEFKPAPNKDELVNNFQEFHDNCEDDFPDRIKYDESEMDHIRFLIRYAYNMGVENATDALPISGDDKDVGLIVDEVLSVKVDYR